MLFRTVIIVEFQFLRLGADDLRTTKEVLIDPRLCVFRSNKNIEAQLIDDVNGVTLVSASSTQLKLDNGGNCEGAAKVGAELAKKAKAKGIKVVCFDRNGYLYHGRVAALADAAREGGLEF